jgi:ATP-dependent DNA helicase RecG
MVIRAVAPDELAGLIAAGEDSFTEFKESSVSTQGLAKEMCAFLNTNGGRVLIGVTDDGAVVGLGDWDDEKVMNVARTLLEPPVLPTFQRVIPPGSNHDVGVVGVDVGVEKPYAVGGGEGKRYYVRAGTTSREASREELIRLTQASGAVAGDLRPVLGASLADLDDELLQARFAGRRSIDWPALEEDARIQVLGDAEILHPETRGPTVAGLLCFGRAPQDHIPYAVVTCVAYRGTAVERELLDRAEAGGRVEEQITSAVAFIERNLRSSSRVQAVERVDQPRPSAEALREVVANAVAHRHYGIASPCQVRVFADRLEVQSPGGLPNGVTAEAMRVGVSVRRNPFLIARLSELGMVDAVGRGFVLVVEEALALGLPEPEVRTPEGFVEVVISLAP